MPKISTLTGRKAVRHERAGRVALLALVAALLWLALPAVTLAANFTAALDRDNIALGESATLTLSVVGNELNNPPTVPPIANVNIGGPSVSQQSSFVFNGANSQTTHQVSYAYSLTPTQVGEYVIPAISVVIDGQPFTSQPAKLTVTKAAAPTANPKTIFLKLVIPKTEVYIGEILPLEIQLYLAEQIHLSEMPHFNEQGFTLGKMLQPTQSATVMNNQRYEVVSFKTCVVAAKVGNIDLGPASVAVSMVKPNSRRSGWPFNEALDWQNVTVESEPQTVKVLPLPKENVPVGFCGAVGNFSLAMTVSPTNVSMGDPISVKVQITGRGAMDSVGLPPQNDWQQFKLYPPTSEFQPSDQLGLNGTKTFGLTAVPQSMDVTELPPFQFSFFDPEQKGYRTLTQPATPLIVRPSAASLPPPVASNATANDGQPSPAKDISHIKPRFGVLAQFHPPLVRQPWFIALQGIPVLAWFSLFVIRKQKERLANNPRLRRQMEVEKTVGIGLKELRQSADANQPEPFFATMFHLLQEQLGERLDLPASAITEDVLEERLRPMQVPEETLALLRELFHACNQARYAPQSTNEELISLIPRLESALNELKQIKA